LFITLLKHCAIVCALTKDAALTTISNEKELPATRDTR
jgi:hypothetical protein